jgi:membrane-associated phospholipid phosphatase
MTLLKQVLEFDAHWSSKIRLDDKDDFLHHLFSFLAHSADSWFLLPVIGILWFFSQGDWRQRFAILGIGVFIQAVLVLLLKFMIRRRRPEGEWGAIYRNTDPHSFTSGHAARVALMSAILVATGPAWLASTVTFWAIFVCLARVMMGVHYLSDILGGIVVGIFVGWAMIDIVPLLILYFPFIF